MSAGESTSRNQESARKIRNRHQELATQECVKADDAASGPRGKAESFEVRREIEGSHQCETDRSRRWGARQTEAVSLQVSGRFTRSDDKIPKEREVGFYETRAKWT